MPEPPAVSVTEELIGLNAPKPIVVPSAQAFPPSAITQSPPFGGEPDLSPLPATPALPSPDSLGLVVVDGESATEVNALPSFPLEEGATVSVMPEPSAVRPATLPSIPPPQRPIEALQAAVSSAWQRARRSQRVRNTAERAGAAWQRSRPVIVKWGKAAHARSVDAIAFARSNPGDPRTLVAVGGGIFGIGLVVVLLIRTGKEPKRNEPTAELAPSAAVAASAAVAPLRSGLLTCGTVRSPIRIAPKVSKDVPLEVLSPPSDVGTWIGFSADSGSARGVVIEPRSDTVADLPMPAAADRVRVVTPFLSQGTATFATSVHRADDRVRSWRTLSIDPPLVVGQGDGAVAVAAKPSENGRALWPLEGDGSLDALRSISVTGQGHAIAFRRRGAIWAGWIDATGAARGDLTRILGAGAPEGSPIGSPALAHTGREIVVAFADRASNTEPWGVRLGYGNGSSLPDTTAAFPLPPGGPGKDAIAPSLAGLGDGRVLLVWTEGSGTQHDVRAQALGADQAPMGAPFTISRPSVNAGQGAVGMSDGRGIVAYLELGQDGYEMWAVRVECR